MAIRKRKSSEYLRLGNGFVPAALIALLGFGSIVFWVRAVKPLGLDRHATLTFQTIRNPVFYRLMAFVSSLGYAPAVHVLLISAAGILWITRNRLESLFTLASAGAAASVVIIKRLVGRPRPAGERIRVAVVLPDYGFPSGHTVHFVSFFGFLAYLAALPRNTTIVHRLLLALFNSLIALIGPSRVYLGQHWLSDVVAAYLLGFAYLVSLVGVYEWIKARKSR